jgi:hypothetical protein
MRERENQASRFIESEIVNSPFGKKGKKERKKG